MKLKYSSFLAIVKLGRGRHNTRGLGGVGGLSGLSNQPSQPSHNVFGTRPRATSSRQNIFYETCVAVVRLLRERWPWWWCSKVVLDAVPVTFVDVYSAVNWPRFLCIWYCTGWDCASGIALGSCASGIAMSDNVHLGGIVHLVLHWVRLWCIRPIPQVQPESELLRIAFLSFPYRFLEVMTSSSFPSSNIEQYLLAS